MPVNPGAFHPVEVAAPWRTGGTPFAQNARASGVSGAHIMGMVG
jgi:hypothetical protein